MPVTEQLADAERVGSFFQRARPAAAVPPAAPDDAAPAPGPQGPVFTNVPPSRPSTSGPVPMRPIQPRGGAPESLPEPPRNAPGPGGAEPETTTPGTTAPPPSTVILPGPGGG